MPATGVRTSAINYVELHSHAIRASLQRSNKRIAGIRRTGRTHGKCYSRKTAFPSIEAICFDLTSG